MSQKLAERRPKSRAVSTSVSGSRPCKAAATRLVSESGRVLHGQEAGVFGVEPQHARGVSVDGEHIRAPEEGPEAGDMPDNDRAPPGNFQRHGQLVSAKQVRVAAIDGYSIGREHDATRLGRETAGRRPPRRRR